MKTLKKSKGGVKPILFVPITKMDEEKRLVYGTMVQGSIVDHADEIFDYATSKPLFEKWSAAVEKASDGKSLGNVRAMHSNIAAGKLTQIVYDDPNEVIECCAKIVDDAEWAKCVEGVYTGFSIGGKYIKKWKDGDAFRYTAEPVEVSIVDVPCVPTATFQYAKADGVTVDVAFKAAKKDEAFMPDAQAIAGRALEMATAKASAENWVDHIDEAREALIKEDGDAKAAKEKKKSDAEAAAHADEANDGNEEEDGANEESSDAGGSGDGSDEADAKDKKKDKKSAADDKDAEKAAQNAISQVWKTTDGKTFAKKADAVPHQAAINASRAAGPLADALADLSKALGSEGGEVPEVFTDLTKAGIVLAALTKRIEGTPFGELRKNMYDVGWFARVIEDIACIQSSANWEAEMENDDSPVPANLKANIQALCMTFVEMAIEEAGELVARLQPEEVESIVAGAKVTDGVGGSQEDDSADPEVAVHVAEGVKYLVARSSRLEKAGARNSKSDQERMQKAHDALVEMGAVCKAVSTDDDADAEKVAKGVFTAVETERDTLRLEAEGLRKQIGDAIPKITQLTEEVRVLKAQPVEGGPRRTSVVGKTEDRAGVEDAATEAARAEMRAKIAKMSPSEQADLLIRMSQSNPQSMIDRGTLKS